MGEFWRVVIDCVDVELKESEEGQADEEGVGQVGEGEERVGDGEEEGDNKPELDFGYPVRLALVSDSKNLVQHIQIEEVALQTKQH